jgi:acyl-CoA synthetase (AMP-forming)/AMP-acid ligase II
MNYKVWIGKEGKFAEEVQKLISILNVNNNIALSTEPAHGYDWIVECQEAHFVEFLGHGGSIALRTSGTTGTPKLIWKDFETIYHNKKGRGSEEDVWLLTYNPARWAGLSVILHCMKTNAKLMIPESLTVENMLGLIDQVTHISLTPSLFRKMMITNPDKLAKAPLKQLTFGGEYATQKILDDAKAIFPNARITHIYATTESGDLCACSDGLEGFPEEKMPRLENGDNWKFENGRAYFVGRDTEVINVGGAKITQTEVENAANSIPQISQCRAFPIANALLGQVVGLEYVGDIDPRSIKIALLQKLPKYAVPLQITQVDSIELTSANKIQR